MCIFYTFSKDHFFFFNSEYKFYFFRLSYILLKSENIYNINTEILREKTKNELN